MLSVARVATQVNAACKIRSQCSVARMLGLNRPKYGVIWDHCHNTIGTLHLTHTFIQVNYIYMCYYVPVHVGSSPTEAVIFLWKVAALGFDLYVFVLSVTSVWVLSCTYISYYVHVRVHMTPPWRWCTDVCIHCTYVPHIHTHIITLSNVTGTSIIFLQRKERLRNCHPLYISQLSTLW